MKSSHLTRARIRRAISKPFVINHPCAPLMPGVMWARQEGVEVFQNEP